jgi:hypothetical protein
MFLYRRNRHALLNPAEDTTNGIRLNIPLTRVAGALKSKCLLSFACMVSITVAADPLAGNEGAASSVGDSDSSSERAFSDKSVILNPENESEPYVVQLSMIRQHPIWDDLMSHVEKANAAVAADTTDWPGSRLYIDYDPRADLEDEDFHNQGLSSLQRFVSSTLGLDRTKEFFSEWRFPRPRHILSSTFF